MLALEAVIELAEQSRLDCCQGITISAPDVNPDHLD